MERKGSTGGHSVHSPSPPCACRTARALLQCRPLAAAPAWPAHCVGAWYTAALRVVHRPRRMPCAHVAHGHARTLALLPAGKKGPTKLPQLKVGTGLFSLTRGLRASRGRQCLAACAMGRI